MSQPDRWRLSGKQTLLVLAALGALVVWYELTPKPAPAPAAPTVEAPSQVLGQTRHLQNPNSPQVTLLGTKTALDLAVRAQATGNQTAAQQATENGLLVPNGTTVQVIDTDTVEGLPARQVRVSGGTFAGQSGWVLANSLAP